MASSDPPVPEGVVAGKYRLTRLLGRGAMGAVWEGSHISLGTRVAVKFIDAEYAESPEAQRRFENEARAAAKLRSKHVVEVYDHGVSEDARPFIVMEFLQGEPLDKRLDRVSRLPAKETARIVSQICRALSKAHAANIVHRDLKPENVFLVWDEEDRTDVVKVVDFGIAKFNDTGLASSSATRTGSLLGTPHYMSPEQARGLRSVDSRSDLWSVAVIAYRCIVGTLPFEGEAVGDLLVNLCTAPLPVPSQVASDIPLGFDAWLAKAMSRDPALRFATAAELADSLGAVCGLSVRGRAQNIGQDGGSEPYPALASGQLPIVITDAGFATVSSAQTTALATSAPTTQTPVPPIRMRTGARAVAACAALIVLGSAAALALKVLTPSPAAAVLAGPPPLAPMAPKTIEPTSKASATRTDPSAELVSAPPSAAPAAHARPTPSFRPPAKPMAKSNLLGRHAEKPAPPNMGF